MSKVIFDATLACQTLKDGTSQVGGRFAQKGAGNIIPVLTHMLISAEGNKFSLTATDLNVGNMRSFDALKVDVAGSVTVQVSSLLEILANTTDETVRLYAELREVNDKDSAVDFYVIHSYGKQKLNSYVADEFPKFFANETDTVAIDSTDLKSLLARNHAMGKDANAANTYGAFITGIQSGDNKAFRMVATDGTRLSITQTDTQSVDLSESMLEGFILSRDVITDLEKAVSVGEPATIGFDDNNVVIKSPSLGVIVARKVDASPIDYERAIPRSNSIEFDIDRTVISLSINRLLAVSSKESPAVAFELGEGKITLSTEDAATGCGGTETFDIGYDGPAIRFGLSGKLVKQTLASLNAEMVKFCVADPNSGTPNVPVIIRESDSDLLLDIVAQMRV